MTAQEKDGHVRIVVCQRGGMRTAAFIPEATGVYRCFHCNHEVVLLGDDSTLVAAGTIDAVCEDCAVELNRTMGLFQPEDLIPRAQL